MYIGGRGQPQFERALLQSTRNPMMVIGQNYLAANISQFFNFQGPSLVVDTACSSALVAMNMAVDALQAGKIESALVGGVGLLTDQKTHQIFERRNLLQKDGKYHILDQRASGIVLGEGVGVVYLKTLSSAERDGDTIYSVISGISINNDGRTAGHAAPNVEAQKAVMKTALNQGACRSEEVRYIDVNGSGSLVTDLLEIKAIDSIYRNDISLPCYLGSMKPNIGHPLCAEGIASFIKVCLMIHHQTLVPFLSGHEPLKHYSLESKNFVLPRETKKIQLACAALNSFADGGTNAHVVMKHYHSGCMPKIRNPKEMPPMKLVDIRSLGIELQENQ